MPLSPSNLHPLLNLNLNYIFAFPPNNIVICNFKLDWGERNDCWVVWILIMTLKEGMVSQRTLHQKYYISPKREDSTIKCSQVHFLKHCKIQIFQSIFHHLIRLKLIWLIVSRIKSSFYISEASSPWPACQRWPVWGFRDMPGNSHCIDFPNLTLSITKDFGLGSLLWLFFLLANSQRIPED